VAPAVSGAGAWELTGAWRSHSGVLPFALSAPLVAAEPIVDHRMSQRFRLLAATGYNFWNAFDATGMNDDNPVIPFNPGADGIAYTPVLHHTSPKVFHAPTNRSPAVKSRGLPPAVATSRRIKL
jgi:hypothetical protein